MHQETVIPDDELGKLSIRAAFAVPPSNRPAGPVADADNPALYSADVTHPDLVHGYERAIANEPPPNDPVLMPGQLHRPSGPGGHARNGSGSPGTGGFGVSAERSGCQGDSPSSYGGGGA